MYTMGGATILLEIDDVDENILFLLRRMLQVRDDDDECANDRNIVL